MLAQALDFHGGASVQTWPGAEPACSLGRDVQDLKAHMSSEAEACLSLGLPATVSHVIDDESPLANISIQTMAARNMEVRASYEAGRCMSVCCL